jgi:hypothetical protein
VVEEVRSDAGAACKRTKMLVVVKGVSMVVRSGVDEQREPEPDR